MLWQQPLPVTEDTARTPGLVGRRRLVFVASPGGGLTAHDPAATGASSGRQPVGTSLRPVVAGAGVAVATPDAIRVLEQRTGEPAWFSELDPGTSAIVSIGDRLAAIAGAEMRTWDAAGAPAARVQLGGTPVDAGRVSPTA